MLTLDSLQTKVAPALDFIDRKWAELIRNARHGHHDTLESWKPLAATSSDGHLYDLDHNNPHILFLPNDFVSPGGRFMAQFYWDSYFIILSLLLGNRFELARGMVENCLFLVEKYGMVIANRKRWAAGSQLPFLSEMVKEIYQINQDRDWLRRRAIPILERGAALFLRRLKPWFSSLLSGKVMPSAFAGRDELQVWSRFGHR